MLCFTVFAAFFCCSMLSSSALCCVALCCRNTFFCVILISFQILTLFSLLKLIIPCIGRVDFLSHFRLTVVPLFYFSSPTSFSSCTIRRSLICFSSFRSFLDLCLLLCFFLVFLSPLFYCYQQFSCFA